MKHSISDKVFKLKGNNNEQIIERFNNAWNKKIDKVLKKCEENERESLLRYLNNQRHEEYIELLCNLGIIINFPDDLLTKMKDVYVNYESLYDHFFNGTTRGMCYSMSTALSLVILNSNLIKGTINIPLISFEHQWLEYNDKVYDTTFKKIFPKKIYYDIFKPTNINKLTPDDIDNIKNGFFTKISTEKPKPKFR